MNGFLPNIFVKIQVECKKEASILTGVMMANGTGLALSCDTDRFCGGRGISSVSPVYCHC